MPQLWRSITHGKTTKQIKNKKRQKHKKKMDNKKDKRDELWCQYGIQLHPRRMHNIGIRVCIFTCMVMSQGTPHTRHMWYCHLQLKILGKIPYFSRKLNLHEMTATQFCCKSMSCVMGWYQLTILAQQWRWRDVFSSTLIWWPDDTWLEPWQKNRSAPFEPFRSMGWAIYM